MFESPIYNLKGKKDGKKIDVVIDVTGSVPHFEFPGEQLENCFNSLMWTKSPCDDDVWVRTEKPGSANILDFGAAKLRNTLYFLEMGCNVTACDFWDIHEKSEHAGKMFRKCSEYPGFYFLTPEEYQGPMKCTDFDIILLVNVFNCMPLPEERQYALDLFEDNIEDNGRLLWYSQHGARKNTSGISVSDGFVTGNGRENKMFYRDFSRKEVEEMMKKSGFKLEENLHRYSGNNQAYVFGVE